MLAFRVKFQTLGIILVAFTDNFMERSKNRHEAVEEIGLNQLKEGIFRSFKQLVFVSDGLNIDPVDVEQHLLT
jgi:hypothetical protein